MSRSRSIAQLVKPGLVYSQEELSKLVNQIEQALIRLSSDIDNRGFPFGGTSGQVVTKTDDQDFNFDWSSVSGGSFTPAVAMFTVAGGTNLTSSTMTELAMVATGITDSNYSVVSNRIEVSEAGRYKISGWISATATAANYRWNAETAVGVNGTAPSNASGLYSGYIRSSSGHNENGLAIFEVLDLNANDDISIWYRRMNSTAGDAVTVANMTRIIVEKVS